VVPNNHLIANWVGLLVVGLVFPELPTSARQVPRAVTGLREQMLAQVHADGYSFEGSVPYHRLSLEMFALAQVVAQSSGVELGSAFAARLREMFRVAKAYCSDAYRHTAGEGIQIHGGIGFTWEHDLHLYFKRAKSSEFTFGDATHHREKVAQLINL